MVNKQDAIYASPLDQMVDFCFDERVVAVFPDMIRRSVPGYGTLIATIGIMAAKYAQENSHCYDLGCSLGAVSLSMSQRITQSDCDIIAVDNSLAMIERGQQILATDKTATIPVKMVCADIQNVAINDASVVVLNFTLQFIPIAARLNLLQKIYQGLNYGGVLILSEKLAFANQARQDFQTAAHHDFKRAHGYSDLEISQKRTALDNVLTAETLDSHQQRLQQAGFGFSDIWYQCFNFASLIAIKQ